MITIDCKIINFSLPCLLTFLVTISYNIVELTSATSKERMTTNFMVKKFFAGVHALINEKFILDFARMVFFCKYNNMEIGTAWIFKYLIKIFIIVL